MLQLWPFLRAFVLLILLPLLAAAAIQRVAPGRTLSRAEAPMMVVVLVTVVASQAGRILGAGTALLALVPVYVSFLVLATAAGILISSLARLDAGSARALTFSGATRNSLVVLPLALAMPASLALVPAVVVTQTVVELLGMVVLVRILPRLIRA